MTDVEDGMARWDQALKKREAEAATTVEFKPIPCPCGCKKWIMSPWFGCQCSSLRTDDRDALVAMALDAARYRWLRSRQVRIYARGEASPLERASLDDVCDEMLAAKKVDLGPGADDAS